MARQLRIEFPGAFYHITSRGIQKQPIFRDDQDRHTLLDYFNQASRKFGSVFHTFCLMGNHFHLFLETPGGDLSRTMHFINTAYCLYYNARHSRVGHVLQGRFKAILVEADSYALAISRYIHLNPVRAALVSDPEEYPWSSLLEFVGSKPHLSWVRTDFVLSLFSDQKSIARPAYRAFVREGVLKMPKNPLKKAEKTLILGSDLFNKQVKKLIPFGKLPDREVPAIRNLANRPTLEQIRMAVENALGDNNRFTRDAAIFLTHAKSDFSLKEIAAFYSLSFSGIGSIVRKTKKRLEWNQVVKGILDYVGNELFPPRNQ
jgi:putative transposase